MNYLIKYLNKNLLILLFLLSLCLSSTSQNLVVTGISEPNLANGVYEPNGELYGYDSWKHESQNFYIYNDDYVGLYWNIDDNILDNDDVLFYYESSDISPIGLTPWTALGTATTASPGGSPVIMGQISASAPTVTTGTASSITTSGAILNGTVNANNASTTVTFEYGLTSSYGTSVTADQSPVTGSSTNSVSSSISSLSPYTTYHFRVVGVNSEGTTNGPDNTFTTSPITAIVTTQAVMGISTTTATGNGNITNLGVPNPTAHGVCWNTGGTPTILDSHTEEGIASATGAFTSSIISLNANTTYYVRAYATNTAGTVYGNQVSFTTEPLVPTITTQDITSITQTTATGNGNITDLGAPYPTAHGVCWNTGGTPTISDSHTDEGATAATGAFTSSITSLSANTTFYVRAYATNTAGTSYGNEVSFTSSPLPATVTSQAVTDITSNSATGNGNITDLGSPSPTQYGVCWNTGGTPTILDSHTEEGIASSTGAFTSSIISLNANTTYYVRAYATNTAGTMYGNQVSFTTEPLAPTITSQDVTSITQTTATGNGNITDLGAPYPTAHGVCWNTGGTPTISDSHTDEGATAATGAFTSSITSLSANTTYYVRAYATNTAGTSYGNEVSFASIGDLPTISTQDVTEITTTTATGNGTIIDLGISNPTAYGICWNIVGSPTISDDITDEGNVSITGSFASEMVGLIENTLYYVRTYATNTAGTSYGNQVSFTTGASSIISNENLYIKLFPNPARDILNIKYDAIHNYENVVFSIIDISGKVVFREILKTSNSIISLGGFTSGMYLIEIKSLNNSIKRKLIIE